MNKFEVYLLVQNAVMFWPVLACAWSITWPMIADAQIDVGMDTPVKPVVGRYGFTSGFE